MIFLVSANTPVEPGREIVGYVTETQGEVVSPASLVLRLVQC